MPTDPLHIFDPELVVPSDSATAELQFWLRMNEWAEDRKPRVGPSTLKALNELAQNPPQVDLLPAGDFWNILGKYISRGFTPSPVPREVCTEHLITNYNPRAGAFDNIERLIQDLRAVGPNGRIAMRTIESCWSMNLLDECSTCQESRLSRIYTPVESELQSTELARVWREAYIDEHPRDPTQLGDFATKMFPAIEFSPNAWKRVNTLVGGPEEITTSIIDHLAVLNDFSVEVWDNHVSTEERQAALGSKGVTCSPEGPRTHKNSKVMRERDFDFQRGQVRCEWHTKMRPNVNRIYFAILDKKIFVGTIVDHLPI